MRRKSPQVVFRSRVIERLVGGTFLVKEAGRFFGNALFGLRRNWNDAKLGECSREEWFPSQQAAHAALKQFNDAVAATQAKQLAIRTAAAAA